MATRWSSVEIEELKEMRQRLSDDLRTQPPFPEVVGDRRMLRFLRGLGHNVDLATERFSQFLDFRRKFNMDAIRTNIVYKGCSNPSKFPKGDIILKLIPQTVVIPYHTDYLGHPIVVEKSNFSPPDVLKVISQEEYMHFLLYALEYRALVFEQLSAEREQALLELHNGNPPLIKQPLALSDDDVGYGVIVRGCFLRDLSGLSFAHIGHEGQAILRPIMSVVGANYPEFLGKSYIVNTPMIFSVIWQFIKTLLEPRTVKKISIYGCGWADAIQAEVPPESFPKSVGGVVDDSLYNYSDFAFDVEPNKGALWYPGAPVAGGAPTEIPLPGVNANMRGESFNSLPPPSPASPDRGTGTETDSSIRAHSPRATTGKSVSGAPGLNIKAKADGVDIAGFDYFRMQPWLSRLSLRFRRALTGFCVLYIDPLVYYCLTYKMRFALFLAVVVGGCWACRAAIALMMFPCLVYVVLGALV